MDKPETVMRKDDRSGWRAKSVIPLPGIIEKEHARCRGEEPAPAMLEIETSKAYNGGLRASASVVYKTEYGYRTAIGVAGEGDYHRPIQTEPSMRCTDKNVRSLHETALGYLDAVIADVTRHYGVDPLKAPVPEPA